jgi:hypothetical protein
MLCNLVHILCNVVDMIVHCCAKFKLDVLRFDSSPALFSMHDRLSQTAVITHKYTPEHLHKENESVVSTLLTRACYWLNLDHPYKRCSSMSELRHAENSQRTLWSASYGKLVVGISTAHMSIAVTAGRADRSVNLSNPKEICNIYLCKSSIVTLWLELILGKFKWYNRPRKILLQRVTWKIMIAYL